MAKILIAEDDKFLVRVYKLKLEQSGFEVTFLESGSNVVSVVKENKPDLLVLDLALPGIDGFEIIRTLRSDENYKSLPIIVLSLLKLEKDINEAKSLGASEYLTKSDVEVKDVIEVIKKHV